MCEHESAFRSAKGMTRALLLSAVLSRRIAMGARENSFCAVIARFSSVCAACLKIQAKAMRRLCGGLAPQVARWFAGQADVAVPVMAGGRHVATLFGGQIFRRKPWR